MLSFYISLSSSIMAIFFLIYDSGILPLKTWHRDNWKGDNSKISMQICQNIESDFVARLLLSLECMFLWRWPLLIHKVAWITMTLMIYRISSQKIGGSRAGSMPRWCQLGLKLFLSFIVPPCLWLSVTVSAWGPRMAPTAPGIIPSAAFTNRKEERKKVSFPKPFFMGFSSIITVGNTSQKLLASVTCLDHITICHCRRVWEESMFWQRKQAQTPVERNKPVSTLAELRARVQNCK